MASAAELAQRCEGAHLDKAGWRAKCPVHQGHSDTSLHLWEEGGTLRVHCFSGCKAADILAILGETKRSRVEEHFEAVYTYRNVEGYTLFQVVRKAKKDFRQRRPDPVTPGQWIWNTKDVPLVLYHLPEIQQAITLRQTIYIVEGEKDVETLRAQGLVATCNRGGAGKWDDAYTAELEGAEVVILPDNDKPGHEHAALVAGRLRGAVRKLTILALPELGEHQDVSDWLGAGHTVQELKALGTATTPTVVAPHLILTKFSDVEPEDVSWLWEPYIPLKKLTILEGDPGQGKTYLMLAIAAAITNGHSLPDQQGRVPPPTMEWGTVLYMSGEDDMADTLVPRAIKAGANRERLIAIQGWSSGGEVEPFSFAQLTLLSDAIRDTQAKLIIIDPIQAFIGAQVDIHRTNEVRPLMTQLKNIAEMHRCAILIIRHLTKGPGKALYRGQGSVDFTAAARSVLVVAESLEDESKKVMAQEKSSLMGKGTSQVFQLTGEGFFWCGTSKVNADDLVSQAPRKTAHQQNSAAEWLRHTLDRRDVLANMVFAEAEANGISHRTLERAKTQLKVVSFQKEGKWYWKLPEGWDLDPEEGDIPFHDP